MTFHRVAALDDLWEGEKRSYLVDDKPVLLVKLGGAVLAYEDRCAHQGVALSLGTMEGTHLTCSAHHWQYDLASGQGVNPRSARLKRLPVKIAETDILVDPDAVEQ